MLTMQNVQFGYQPGRTLFDDLDFDVRPGGVVGLLGKNGAGKTTLLKIALGLLFAQNGRSELFGVDAARRRHDVLARVALIPEQFELPPVSITRYGKDWGAYYPRFSAASYRDYLDRFEVPESGKLTQLSYGQQKKVLIAFALASGAELILLDEPTNGLDIPAKRVFRSLVAEAAGQDRAIVISTHQVRDVENLIDPVVVLDEGRVVFEAEMDRLATAVELRRFATEEDAQAAGAFALERSLGQVTALVPTRSAAGASDTIAAGADAAAGTAAGELVSHAVDLELLFQAAISRPTELTAACGGAR